MRIPVLVPDAGVPSGVPYPQAEGSRYAAPSVALAQLGQTVESAGVRATSIESLAAERARHAAAQVDAELTKQRQLTESATLIGRIPSEFGQAEDELIRGKYN